MQRQTTLDFFKYAKQTSQGQNSGSSQQNRSNKSNVYRNNRNNRSRDEEKRRVFVEEITLDSPPPKKSVVVTPSTSSNSTRIFDLGNFFYDDDGMDNNDEDKDDQALLNLAIDRSLHDSKIKDLPIKSLDGFDSEAGKTWIYPINKPLRQYQYEISRTCLFNNTLVTLPTGLGKTFIAAVVMYNFYRWYPEGKIIFMAPTKPLVAQQIEACYELMSINQDDIAEMTGTTQPNERLIKWQTKRIFFLTPQIIANDLLTKGPEMNPDKIKCLVIDEAHKATGNYAYCQVVRELLQYTQNFRIVALSATPGRAANAVQQVITNLLIAKLEIRSDDSPEVRQYAHNRSIEKVIVPLDKDLTHLEELYVKTLEKYTKPLVEAGFLINMDPRKYSKYGLLQEREKMRKKATENRRRSCGIFEYQFACSMTLCHGLELLSFYGQRTLYFYLKGQMDELSKLNTRFRHDLERDESFMALMHILTERFGPMHNNTQATRIGDMVMSHPKLLRLVDIAVKHFEQYASNSSEAGTSSEKAETRIIVFSQYRESVEEITAVLRKHQPLIRPMKFIGQSFSAGKTTKGLTQKEQLRVMKEFKAGNYNTIVATCVAEEGLDIAEVDLIICYDAPKSPIRLVQRMGRTGRKRLGRIVVLLTKGREENCFDRSEYSKNSVYKNILQTGKFELSPHNPRMIPLGLTPRCEKQLMEQLKPFDNAKGKRREKKGDPQPALDNFLSDQQLKEWKNQLMLSHGFTEWTKIYEKSLKFKFRSYKSGKCEESKSLGQQYDINQYYLWQNESQKTFGVGHSTKSSLLVDLSKKCQYLSRLAEENDFDPDDYYFAPDFESFMPKMASISEKEQEKAVSPHIESTGIEIDPNVALKALYYGVEFYNIKNSCIKSGCCDVQNFETWRQKRYASHQTESERADNKELAISKNDAIECRPSTSKSSLAEKSSTLDITFDFNLCTSVDDMFNNFTDSCIVDYQPQSTSRLKVTDADPLTISSPIGYSKSVMNGSTPKSQAATKKWSTPKAPQTLSTSIMVDLENFDDDFSFDFGLDNNIMSQRSISSPMPSSSGVNNGPSECRMIPLERISANSNRPSTPVQSEKENSRRMIVPDTPEHLLVSQGSLKSQSNDNPKINGPNGVSFVASQSPILRRRDNVTAKPFAHVKPYRINDTIVSEVQSKKKFKKDLHQKYGNEFIVSEADLSLAGCSQISVDESESDVEMENVEAIDCYDENDSFVDVNTQPEYLNTQRRIESPTEMQAIYLKSINNSIMCGRRNKFKLVYEPTNDGNKEKNSGESEKDENQPGTSRDYGDFENDYFDADETDLDDRLSDNSFVVPNDYIEYMTQTQKPKKNKKGMQQVKEKSKKNDKDCRITKRLKLYSSSSESGEDL